MNGNKWKVIAIIETIVIAVAVIFAIGFMAGKGKNDVQVNSGNVNQNVTEATTQAPTTAQDSNNETTASEQSNETTAAEESEGSGAFEVIEGNSGLKVTFEVGNKWGGENGSMAYYGYSVILENTGSEKVENWAIKIPVPEDFTADNYWGCESVVEDGYWYLAPVEYTNVLEPGAKIDSVGMNVATMGEIDFDKMVIGTKGEEASGDDSKKNSDTKVENAQTGGDAMTGYQGKLTVDGTKLVDKDGNAVQLRGVSTHGIAWYPDYVNYESFKNLKDFGANTVRLAMYTGENGGYCAGGNQSKLKELVHEGVKHATDLGMYVIIDWHILSDNNPNTYKDAAKDFFEEMSKKYADYDNVIYEICNEPNGGTSWEDVKSYAEEVIGVIRKNDADGIILVGTPTWSQDVDKAAANPIKDYDNIMYVLHFYAATHKDDLRNKMTKAIDGGLPVFISEFSICDASGNGGLDYDSANKWLETINKYGISYVGWNLSNKNESSAIIKPDCNKTSGYTMNDLSDSGKWLIESFN